MSALERKRFYKFLTHHEIRPFTHVNSVRNGMSETTVSTVHLFEGIPNQEAAREYLVELRRPG